VFFKFLTAGIKLKIPLLIIILSYSHFKKICSCEKVCDINAFISDNNIEIIKSEKLKKIRGILKSDKIYINIHFIEEYDEILKHEIFHFLENKHKIKTFKIISETCARIYSS